MQSTINRQKEPKVNKDINAKALTQIVKDVVLSSTWFQFFSDKSYNVENYIYIYIYIYIYHNINICEIQHFTWGYFPKQYLSMWALDRASAHYSCLLCIRSTDWE